MDQGLHVPITIYKHNFFNKLKQMFVSSEVRAVENVKNATFRVCVVLTITASQALNHTKLTFQLIWVDLSSVQWIAIFVKSQNPLLICEVGFEVKSFTPRFPWHLVEEHFWMAIFNLLQGVIFAGRNGKFLMKQIKMNVI